MAEVLLTVADVAERLALSESQIRTQCRRPNGWPHVRLASSIRFTERQVQEIIRRNSENERKQKPKLEPVVGNHFRLRARQAAS